MIEENGGTVMTRQEEIFEKLTNGQKPDVFPQSHNLSQNSYIKSGTLELTPEQISRNEKSYSDLPMGTGPHKLKL